MSLARQHTLYLALGLVAGLALAFWILSPRAHAQCRPDDLVCITQPSANQ